MKIEARAHRLVAEGYQVEMVRSAPPGACQPAARSLRAVPRLVPRPSPPATRHCPPKPPPRKPPTERKMLSMVAGKDGTRLRTRALSATLKTLSPNNRQIISSDETIRQIILPQLERSMADSLSRVQLSLSGAARRNARNARFARGHQWGMPQ